MPINIMNDDTICALATAQGIGAIAIIRVSGKQSFPIVNALFRHNGRPLVIDSIISHKAYFGQIMDDEQVLDEVLVTFFKGPHSFTGEDSAEISIHGSVYVQQRLVELLIAHGARMAEAGEYTRRAFVNGRFDLAQAEAVADLIASQNEATHKVAMNQMRGGFSKELQALRSQLLDITSLMELELDFSEEDVEFADRSQLTTLVGQAIQHISRLADSFRLGNAIKNGIPVAIVGTTNTGKSTLLNALLGEERAIVSDIAGTTRDTIEETLNIGGVLFRFIDTAGLRQTDETIEQIGIERSYKKLSEADIVIGMLDLTAGYDAMLHAASDIIEKLRFDQQHLILVLNKVDRLETEFNKTEELREDLHLGDNQSDIIVISAKKKLGLDQLKHCLSSLQKNYAGEATLVTNLRHFEALCQALDSLKIVEKGLEEQIPTDLVAQDLRLCLYHLGSITGEVTTDEVLGNIFGKFCIGK